MCRHRYFPISLIAKGNENKKIRKQHYTQVPSKFLICYSRSRRDRFFIIFRAIGEYSAHIVSPTLHSLKNDSDTIEAIRMELKK